MNEAGQKRRPFLFGINYEMDEGFFIEEPLNQNDILFSINGIGNKPKRVIDTPVQVAFSSYPIASDAYEQKFDIIHNGLKRGDSFLANLTIRTKIEMNLSLADIFHLSVAPYTICLPERFVCFSPERFVQIKGGVISSNPMKGTIDASVANAEALILNDFKETAEHNTIVDLIRNDMSIIASNVSVTRYRYIDKIETRGGEILQVSSEISGRLSEDYHSHLGDIIFGMLPAGSISGAPKDATVSLIKSAEGEDRGYYTGIFGYYDGTDLDSGVMIRFIEKDGADFYYRSGGGITAYSKCRDEYEEVLNKIYLPFL